MRDVDAGEVRWPVVIGTGIAISVGGRGGLRVGGGLRAGGFCSSAAFGGFGEAGCTCCWSDAASRGADVQETAVGLAAAWGISSARPIAAACWCGRQDITDDGAGVGLSGLSGDAGLSGVAP